MKKWLQISVIIIFLMGLLALSYRKDQLDLLTYHASELRQAMAHTYQLQAKGGLISKSAEGTCWLAFNQVAPEIAWYTKGDEAHLHTEMVPMDRWIAILKKKSGMQAVITADNLIDTQHSYRLNIERVLDWDKVNKRMIFLISSKGPFKNCPRKAFHGATLFLKG